MPSFDPKQMARMMQQMGITQKNVPAKRVVIELEDSNIIISSPQVTEVSAAGQTSFQIAGHVSRELAINEEDVRLVMEQTGAAHDIASDALKNTRGDIAEAILILKKEK